MAELLAKNRINLICFFQICPETYSYTVNEAVAAKIPVLSVDLGAGADRIKENNLGWIVSKNADANEVIKKFNEILNNEAEYNQMVESVKNYNFKTIADMGEDYREIYTVDNASANIDYAALRNIVKEELRFSSNIVVNTMADRMLTDILQSTKWRIISKIKVPKFIAKPAKSVLRFIKKIIKG